MQSLFKLIINCTRTIDYCPASAFSKNLEHLSHTMLSYYFNFLTGKCWLGRASLTILPNQFSQTLIYIFYASGKRTLPPLMKIMQSFILEQNT